MVCNVGKLCDGVGNGGMGDACRDAGIGIGLASASPH
jgi:hypothetical protein